jgi:hypothetical protein
MNAFSTDDYDFRFGKTSFAVITRLGSFLWGFCIRRWSLAGIRARRSFGLLWILRVVSFVGGGRFFSPFRAASF